MNSHTIVGLTVTYADRAELCIETCNSALRAGIDRIAIVMNGVTPRSEEILRSYAEGQPKALLARCDVNSGSAGGFAKGISKVLELEADLFWLLDDDNLVQPDALATLITHFESLLGTEFAHLPPTLCSLRKSCLAHSLLLSGMPPHLVFPAPGSSMNFDLRRFFRLWVWHKRGENGSCAALTELPFAPYGGLLLHRMTIEAIGLPSEFLVLYNDDTEYTSRIAPAGGRLYLVRESLIEDADAKWTSNGTGRGPALLFTAWNEVRNYYYVRNRTWRERRMTTTRWEKLLYHTNSVIFLMYTLVAALVARRPRELRVLTKAMWKGYRGDFTGGPSL
ncbi:glycosyltransferase [Mycobacterium pinniadriaticum]|uniref:glycosyltransferase n=1 Tax=Mycobacterium pinniadriaticum TaxID=2994102 RepID=UPI003899657C